MTNDKPTLKSRYAEASIKTAGELRSIAHSRLIRDISTLSLPEIDGMVDLVARIIPAGNVPGVILNGLARLRGSAPPPQTAHRDINLIFKGLRQTLDKAVYGAFFAGPAAVIWGYQNLLKLAGTDPADAFPNGVWQFYVEYALREDSARHANETRGFDALLAQHQIQPDPIDRCAAWTMTAIHTLHRYNSLLRNEWRERVYTYLLREATQDTPYAQQCAGLYRRWEGQRPYKRPANAPSDQDYAIYRRVEFDRFLEEALVELPNSLRRRWLEAAQKAKAASLPAYQRQMSILARLDPGPYGESIVPIPLGNAQVGIIHRGRYYLLPLCAPGTTQMPDVSAVRAQLAALMQRKPELPAVSLIPLAETPRAHLPDLQEKSDAAFRQALDALQQAPILINCDTLSQSLPLAQLRQGAERGIGSHPLTILDAGQTFVFDQSHIFFDGVGGAALSEIMTNEAAEWAVYLNTLPPPQPAQPAPRPLTLNFQPEQLNLPHRQAEAVAESDAVNLKAIQSLRKLFKRRNDLLQFTVNDLLSLYRAIHACTYRPSADILTELQALANDGGPKSAAASVALKAISPENQRNPAILIPVDASQRSPRDRLYPMNFEVPLEELDLLTLHQQSIQFLKAYKIGSADYAQFDRVQRRYLAMLAGFGAVMSRAKEIAIAGEAASVGTVKLLAHLPTPLQRLLDSVPGQFDLLNDLIKGREIFSNVGKVASTSTLTRFITAKDDNEKKILAWGILTDAQGVMRISLRDFRPHVIMLVELGYGELASRITQDYLNAYTFGLNKYIQELYRITLAGQPSDS